MADEGALQAVDLESMRENAGRAAALLKCMANEARLQVLCALATGELSVGELNQRIDLSQSALSQHLRRLRQEGLVETRQEAQSVYYSLASDNAIRIIHTLHDIYCR